MTRPCPHCGATHDARVTRCAATGLPLVGDPSLVGSIVADRYHLVRLLGGGGMGAVYKAADKVLRRFVAIKMLHAVAAQNPVAARRFEREARAAAAIGHPNIVDIMDFGDAGGAPYLVMEYLRGRSLAHAISTDGPFHIVRACAITTHTLAGLAAAHDAGILHRDLKPANLMLVSHLGDKDFVKICDFGFAALLWQRSAGDTQKSPITPVHTLVGTPAYAAPERLVGRDSRDPGVDVYALGVVLFEMLAGTRPFDAPTLRELAHKVRSERAPSVRTLRPDVPAALDHAIARALARDPADRWPDARTFADALVPFGGRTVVLESDAPSDSFTMDLVAIRARETQRRSVVAVPDMRPGDESTTNVNVIGPDVAPQPAHAAPPPAAATTVAMPQDAPAGTMEPGALVRAFRGDAVVSVLRFVTRRYGERALKSLLEELPSPTCDVFLGGVTPDAWVSYAAVGELVTQIDARLGRNDLRLVVECGRAIAEGLFPTMRALQPPAPPPELLLAELPAIAAQIVRGVGYAVRRVGRGYGRVEAIETGLNSVTGCVASLGFMHRSLDRFGAPEVEVNLLSCRALGDPACLFDITWLI